jgi:hypothetical protein
VIIWNDYKYGENIFQQKEVKTKRWQMQELKTLILYMILNDFAPKDIRDKLAVCCKDNIKYLRDNQKREIFDKLITKVKNELPKKDEIDKSLYTQNRHIDIYSNEIEYIKALNSVELQQIAFVLLVYCKWLHNLEWFNMSKADIYKEAKLTNVNSKKQHQLLSELLNLGYLDSKVVKLNKNQRRNTKDAKLQMWKLNYIKKADVDDEVVLTISNYNDFVYRYLNYVYGGYFECKECGGIFKQNKYNNRKYCKDCLKYQPIETKIIICVDCGIEMNIDARNNTKTRCNDCQKIKSKELMKKRVQKHRNKDVM